MPVGRSIPYGTLGGLACLAAIFVIYGSLLPFEYREAPLHYSFGEFAYIKWIHISIYSRADLVANIILYVPIGFFTYGAISRWKLGGAILTALFGVSLAICIEFLQICAAPRTVSLNDIAAEITGTGIGLFGWALWGKRIVRTIQDALSGGPKTVSAALGLYLLAYISIALFPFDFLVSKDEIAAQLADPNALVWAPHDLFSIRGLVSLILKTALMLPVGIAIKLIWHRSATSAILAAGALAGGIEIIQWFQHSGRTEASNAAAAMLGAAAGHQITGSLQKIILRLTPWLKAGIWLTAPLYLTALAILRGWRPGYAGRSNIEDVLASLHWMPFYYHYFTSEQVALSSLLSIAISYAPVGVFVWAIRIGPGKPVRASFSLGYCALAAIVLASIIEGGALVTTGRRPDPTNLLIAAAAAMLAHRVCEWTARVGPDLLLPRSHAQ